MGIEEVLNKAGDGAVVHYLELILNLLLALVLGAIVSARPWRRLLGMSPQVREMVQAQLLITVAGAVAVSVIGDSLARAFGLVGLGGFIRFRTGIRDPRDAAVFFLLIGLGMACGLGAHAAAVTCALFMSFVLFLLDITSRGRESSYLRITAQSNDPRGAAVPAQEALAKFPVVIRARSVKIESREIRFDLENPKGVAPDELVHAILEATKDMVQSIHYERLETLKGIVR